MRPRRVRRLRDPADPGGRRSPRLGTRRWARAGRPAQVSRAGRPGSGSARAVPVRAGAELLGGGGRSRGADGARGGRGLPRTGTLRGPGGCSDAGGSDRRRTAVESLGASPDRAGRRCAPRSAPDLTRPSELAAGVRARRAMTPDGRLRPELSADGYVAADSPPFPPRSSPPDDSGNVTLATEPGGSGSGPTAGSRSTSATTAAARASKASLAGVLIASSRYPAPRTVQATRWPRLFAATA